MAQRLVRKLCSHCKKEYEPDEEEVRIVKKILDSFPKTVKKPTIKKIKLFKAVGCEKCNNIGYKGRLGIFEAIRIDEKIERLILKNPSINFEGFFL